MNVHLVPIHKITSWQIRVVVHPTEESYQEWAKKHFDHETVAGYLDYDYLPGWKEHGVLAELHYSPNTIDCDTVLHEARHALDTALDFLKVDTDTYEGREFDAEAHAGFMTMLLKILKLVSAA